MATRQLQLTTTAAAQADNVVNLAIPRRCRLKSVAWYWTASYTNAAATSSFEAELSLASVGDDGQDAQNRISRFVALGISNTGGLPNMDHHYGHDLPIDAGTKIYIHIMGATNIAGSALICMVTVDE